MESELAPWLLQPRLMLALIGFSFFSALVLRSTLLFVSAKLSHPIHEMCLNSRPFSRHEDLYQALVCGESVTRQLHRLDFTQTGLIHLLIVSGSQLLFLEAVLKTLAKPLPRVLQTIPVIFGLSLAVLIAGLNPPLVRAFFSWALRQLSERFQLGWTRLQIVLVSLCLTLSFVRDENGALSLALSGVAAIAFALAANVTHGRELRRKRKPSLLQRVTDSARRVLIRQGILYGLMAPALMGLSIPNPLVIFWNATLGTLLGHLVFPLSLSAFIAPVLTHDADFVWDEILRVISYARLVTPPGFLAEPTPTSLICLYAMSLIAFAVMAEQSQRRRQMSQILKSMSQKRVTSVCLALTTSLFVLFGSSSEARADENRDQETASTALVVWNVGQGLWTTIEESSRCLHFDTGGERNPVPRVLAQCRGKQNELRYSHWDWDHVGLIGKLKTQMNSVCMAARPGGQAPRDRAKIFEGIPSCATPTPHLNELVTTRLAKTANDSSRAFILDQVLFPGDASRAEEKSWVHNRSLSQVRILIVGHHGSRTSTSEALLDQMPQLKMAIVSARMARYGHPHAEVIERLQRHGVPVLRTEEWGEIHVDLSRTVSDEPRERQAEHRAH